MEAVEIHAENAASILPADGAMAVAEKAAKHPKTGETAE